MQTLRPELLEILVCPVPECRRSLVLEPAGLRCVGCGRVYAVTEGWPVLIPEEAALPATTTEPAATRRPDPAT